MKPGSLSYLFNVDLVDFVKLLPDGTYVAVEWPKDATHWLRGGMWNNPKNYKPNGHGKVQMPDGYALAVCAEPMVRPTMLARGRVIKIRKPIPEGCSAYNPEGGIAGKRAVLLELVQATKADVKKTFIKEANDAQLNTLYRNLKVADFYLE